jgi:integrase
VPLSAITATTIADFQRARHDAGIANRTINMDVGVLSRVLKFCGRWRALADHVHNLPERQRPIGRAPTAEERRRLFDTAASNPEWEHVYCAANVAANTSMRPVEVKHVRRCDADLVKRLVHVRRARTRRATGLFRSTHRPSKPSRESSSAPTCSGTQSQSTISGRRASGDGTIRRNRC